MDYRSERDALGEVPVPAQRLYGASTARAIANLPIAGAPLPIAIVRALALVKLAAARVNRRLGLLAPDLAELIERAAREVADGLHDGEFPVGVFQTGSGTSTNMNVNEVVANRAAQLAGEPIGRKRPVHPNDHVNRGQSSNDAFPSAVSLAAALAAAQRLRPALERLHAALTAKALAWADVVKIGRTHLMDAVPITLGQEFSGYATQIAHGLRRLDAAIAALRELPIGGTAVGTGINTDPRFGALVCAELAELTGEAFREAAEHREAQAARDAWVEASGLLKTIAVSLSKIANDLRLLGSGPRCGLGELSLPALQPGSSIMPGKVNPIVSEAVVQVAVQVVANDAAIALGGFGGVGSILDLNVAMPVMGRALIESIGLLADAAQVLAAKAVDGLVADERRCRELIAGSLAMVTPLVEALGYDRAAALAGQAWGEGRTVREVALESGVLSAAELDRLLDPLAMTRAGARGGEG